MDAPNIETPKAKSPAAKKTDPIAAAKLAAIQNALAQIKKQYGDGAIMEMSDKNATTIGRFPSGSLSLDLALGGGFPEGRSEPRTMRGQPR